MSAPTGYYAGNRNCSSFNKNYMKSVFCYFDYYSTATRFNYTRILVRGDSIAQPGAFMKQG